MNFIVPDVGKIAVLAYLNSAYLVGCTMHLSSNDVSIGSGTVLGDFTECSGSGYSAQGISGFATPTIDGSGRAASEASPIVFSGPDDSSDIYCAYITDGSGNLVMAGLLDGAPVTIPTSGTLVITFTGLDTTIF